MYSIDSANLYGSVDTFTFFQSDITWPGVGAHATEISPCVSQVGTESDPVAGV